jgi:hypothetical protein
VKKFTTSASLPWNLSQIPLLWGWNAVGFFWLKKGFLIAWNMVIDFQKATD